jgi:hypothetical protein
MTGLGIVVGIVLIVLKLAGVADLGWFLATLPLWLGLAIDVVLTAIFGSIAAAFAAAVHRRF